MSIDFWDGLNMGLEFDMDEEENNLQISLDHDELKGEINLEFKNLLNETLEESFESAEDVESVEDSVIPEYEGIKQYLEECINMIDHKIKEANGFVEENSD